MIDEVIAESVVEDLVQEAGKKRRAPMFAWSQLALAERSPEGKFTFSIPALDVEFEVTKEELAAKLGEEI